ncbi:MAG: pyridoxamine 5'-phosphate oxidase family protein [Mitsuaria chitosanitabida]|uniref:pyridoxamine 5'-phosphate oxidase family protein n=1 Tax=Roseateles chitosanitabidus TaxID=65048 RepID=UPI001B120ECF|nr:pyridoxamine 5'-phosphate oxidase family protein [Roseateles chitosanitabidus]MBO9689828.1 pyridoxamine 5'-phosphate oxidase family protein [Roseateles chitosanitabidus]
MDTPSFPDRIDAPDTTWHPGEQILHQRLGLRDRMAEIGAQVVRDHMPDQHRELFGKLPTMLLGALDAGGQPWATMLAGRAGFVDTPDARTMTIAAAFDGQDPALAALRARGPGAPVGLLGLEPHTRRRNRMNGRLLALTDEALAVGVVQSFGNCPKYIQARDPMAWDDTPPAIAQPLGAGLDARAIALLSAADTVFIASASAPVPGDGRSEGVDVSHRGGPPGFVRVQARLDGGIELRIEDFPGNRFFMTLGNLLRHPRAGLLVPDYASGELLHLAAQADVHWAGDTRELRLRVTAALRRPGALPWRWSEARLAPQFTA